jgi:WD40 repeat protein
MALPFAVTGGFNDKLFGVGILAEHPHPNPPFFSTLSIKQVNRLVISTGGRIALATSGKTVIYTYQTRPTPVQFPPDKPGVHSNQFNVTDVVFLNDINSIIVSTENANILCYKLDQPNTAPACIDGEGLVNCLAVNHQFLASGNDDGSLRLFPRPTLDEIVPITRYATITASTAPIRAVCWSSDGTFVIAGSQDGFVHFVAVGDKKFGSIKSVKVHEDVLLRVVLSADGVLMATTSADGTAKLWEICAMEMQFRFELKDEGDRLAWIWDAAFVEIDGRTLVVTVGTERIVRTWDCETGNLIHKTAVADARHGLTAVAIHPGI